MGGRWPRSFHFVDLFMTAISIYEQPNLNGLKNTPTASLQSSKTSPLRKSSGYVTQPSNSEAPVLELMGVLRASSLPLLPNPLYPRVVVAVRVLSKGQLEICNHFLY